MNLSLKTLMGPIIKNLKNQMDFIRKRQIRIVPEDC